MYTDNRNLTDVTIAIATEDIYATAFMEYRKPNGELYAKKFVVNAHPSENENALTIRTLTEAVSRLKRACNITIVTNIPRVGRALQHRTRLIVGFNDWSSYHHYYTRDGKSAYHKTDKMFFCPDEWQQFMSYMFPIPDGEFPEPQFLKDVPAWQIDTYHRWNAHIVTCAEGVHKHHDFNIKFMKDHPEYELLCDAHNQEIERMNKHRR